jgi:hypothetical protein
MSGGIYIQTCKKEYNTMWALLIQSVVWGSSVEHSATYSIRVDQLIFTILVLVFQVSSTQ